jgi:methylenetetrahydrofolate dehydrogenase (NADP+) / methenyltetrahydrofolate cyclohydrolase
MSRLLNGREIAKKMKAELHAELQALDAVPQLRILSFDTPSSQVYWQAQQSAAQSLGIGIVPSTPGAAHASHAQSWDKITQSRVEEILQEWNQDVMVHGIFVHQPMPKQIDAQRISALIDPKKDIEGIHPQNCARRFFSKARIGSCTALAIMRLIEETGVALEGKEAVVVGHSEIVGRPVGMLLLDKLATTTICHIGTNKAGLLEAHVRRADILVAALGQPQFIKGEWIKTDSIVIDVGINVVGGRVVGDIEFEAAKERAAYITPVPGGVGPVTVMMVMKNTIEAFKLQQG